MRKLTITVDSPSRFTTVVTDNGEELNRRQYSDGANCSYSKHSRDMERPYVADALRSIICRYMVHEIEADEAGFEAEFCSGLATYTQYPSLLDEKLREQGGRLSAMSDRELCEAVNAHFASHPTLAGQKDLKTWAAAALDADAEVYLTAYQRDTMVHEFSDMQIQEARLKRDNLDYYPQFLSCELMAEMGGTSIYKMDATLVKNGDGSVSVMGKYAAGKEVEMGRLDEKFLRNNPMNVEKCGAQVELADFSNGKMKNLRFRVVANSDEMSGDIVNLDNNMLEGLGQEGPGL